MIPDFSGLPLSWLVGLFAVATLGIALAGTRIAMTADRLADRAGLGEALVGGLLLGGSTSASGILVSVSAAAQGYADISISNALGGIAGQTAFLALADIAYRKANLEHAAASVPALTQGTVLICLLSLPLLAMGGPDVTLWHIHPATLLLFAVYFFGLRLIVESRDKPMWFPRMTRQTVPDEPQEPVGGKRALRHLWLEFVFLGLVLGSCGYILMLAGVQISAQTGLSALAVGGIFTALATSLPELITTIAAVRMGALTLAVGGILGGNMFDVLFIAAADVAYDEGSIYHAIGPEQQYLTALSIVMTTVILLGLLRRERYGMGRIGLEGVVILSLYVFGIGFVLI